MLQELGRVARETREAAGVRQIEIASAAGVTEPVISNLERGIRFPEKLEKVVDGYEDRCRLKRGDLWRAAAAQIR
jgi:transcriptional regulator with XRE-family HTH domain